MDRANGQTSGAFPEGNDGDTRAASLFLLKRLNPRDTQGGQLHQFLAQIPTVLDNTTVSEDGASDFAQFFCEARQLLTVIQPWVVGEGVGESALRFQVVLS